MYSLKTREQIDEYLWQNWKGLAHPGYLFSADNNQDRLEDFEKADLKILVAFLSPGYTRACSNTFNSLYTNVKKVTKGTTFIDYAYFPEPENIDIFKANGIPFMFGNVSHAPVTGYDLVFISHSILPETFNVPRLLMGSSVSLTIQERLKDTDYPLIVYGGAAANESSILLGDVKDDDGNVLGHSLVDMATYGYAEGCLHYWLDEVIEWKKQGNCPRANKAELMEYLIDNKVQYGNIFYPLYYKWNYKDDGITIKSIDCLDSRLPKQVHFHRITDEIIESEGMGWNTKIFNMDGESAGEIDIHLSSGCSGQSSCCSFSFAEGTLLNTNLGLVRIEQLPYLGTATGSPNDIAVRYSLDNLKVQAQSGVENAPLVYSVGSKPCMTITTQNGYKLSVTKDHKCLVYRYGEALTLEAREIEVGDRVFLSSSEVFGEVDRSLAQCEFVGRMVGAGYYNNTLNLIGYKYEEQDLENLLQEADIEWTVKSDEVNKVSYLIPERYRQEFEFMPYDKTGKSIPYEVFGYSRDQLLAFFRGLLDADAVVSVDGLEIVYSTASKEIHDAIKHLMLSVDIYTTTKEIDTHSFDKDLGFSTTTHLYQLYVWGDQSKSIIRDLELRDPVKRERLANADYCGQSSLEERVLGVGANPYITEDVLYPTDLVVSLDDIGIQNIYDITVEPTHTVVANGFVVNQCMEATVASGYHEVPFEKVKETFRQMKINCAPNSSSVFSFNLNYYSKFMDLLKLQAENFSSISMLNERIDVIAHSPEQLKLAKVLGLKRFSGAVEGMGERMRNKILNKNLDRETFMKAARIVFSQKLMMFKFGMIITGQETKEDMDEFVDEVKELVAIRDSVGATTAFQINFTPLVYYSQIALRYLPRITSEMAFHEVKNMGYLINRIKSEIPAKIKLKFNSKGSATYLEQLLLDFGPAGTNWLIDCVKAGIGYVKRFNNEDRDKAVACLAKNGYNDPLFFTFARPYDFIFPNDHIDVITPETTAMWIESTKKMDFDKKLCLRTPANMTDVKCYGCKACPPSHIKFMTKRPIDTGVSMNEVVSALESSTYRDVSRVVIRLQSKWRMTSVKMLSHYITSRFFNLDNDLVDLFHSVGKNTVTWVTSNTQLDYYSGTVAFDIYWRSHVPAARLNALVDQVNAQLQTCQILAIFDDCKDLKIAVNTDVAYLGTISDLSMTVLKDKLANFDWNIKYAVKVMGGMEIDSKPMPELKDRILFVPHKDKILTYMSLPANVNPQLVLASILGKSYDRAVQMSEFTVMDHGKEIDASCKCGRHLTYSLLRGTNEKVCQLCYGKLAIRKLTQS